MFKEDYIMKKLSIAIMMLIVTIFITGCGNATQSKDQQKSKTVSIKHTYEFKDKNNDHNRGTIKKETIEVPINPKRVAVMDYGALDTMKSLKLEDKIVAISKGQNSSFLPTNLAEFKDDKYLNLGNPGRPNYDNLAKAKPEVIFASFRQAHTATLDEMKKAAPNAKIIFVSPHYDNYIESVKDNALIIGKIFNKENAVNKINTKLDKKLAETKKVINNDKVLFLNVDDKSIKAFGSSGRFGGFLNEALGIKHADKDMKANSKGAVISYEYLVRKNPDKIFVINRGKNAKTNELPESLNNPVIQDVKAVKNNEITLFEANKWFFNEGGVQATIDQMEDVKKAFK
jgi:iron complex transport system substrate-binding protein